MVELPKVLTVKFDKALSQERFWWLVECMFSDLGAFGLWGHPIWLGCTKVHVYGCDRMGWRPLNVEVTQKGLSAIGNAVDYMRLLRNLKREGEVEFRAWIGKEPIVLE